MALYSNSAFRGVYKKVLKQSTQTLPQYLFGNFDPDTADYLFQISQVSLTSNVATATVTIQRGGGGSGALGIISPMPVAGCKMGVQGTVTAGGAFNVDPTTISSISITQSTGAGTITYPVTHANVSATADNGKLIAWPQEVPDLVSLNSSSIPIALSFMPDEADNSRCLFAECIWSGTLPSAATVSLQVANVDDDARYVTIGAINIIVGSAVTQAGAQFSFLMGKFIRAKVTAMTGGDSTTGLVCTVFL